MDNPTQSDVAINIARLNIKVVDDSTIDNELYYEMCLDEINEIRDTEDREKLEELSYKKDYLNLFEQD